MRWLQITRNLFNVEKKFCFKQKLDGFDSMLIFLLLFCIFLWRYIVFIFLHRLDAVSLIEFSEKVLIKIFKFGIIQNDLVK